jgi:hypothetical protein
MCLQALGARLGAVDSRLDVAMRFVNWFSSRGESFEENMRVIDRHLARLAEAAAPSAPSAARPVPFDSHVRVDSGVRSAYRETLARLGPPNESEVSYDEPESLAGDPSLFLWS